MSNQNPIRPVHTTEISREDYLKKIRLLKDELNRLTILENPQEIQRICAHIIEIKKMLEKSQSG
jgi:hypothetical protein